MTMTAILVVNKKPVAHTTGNHSELFKYMMDNYGPFSEPSGWAQLPEPITKVDDLVECYDAHSGMRQSCFDLYTTDGKFFKGYILDSPWYLYNIDDPEENAAIRQYCLDNNIDIESDNQ